MILTYISVLFHSIYDIVPSPNTPYQYSCNIEFDTQLPTAICFSDDDHVYSVETYFAFNDATLYFNDQNDFRISIGSYRFGDYFYKDGEYLGFEDYYHDFNTPLLLIDGNTRPLDEMVFKRYFVADNLSYEVRIDYDDINIYSHSSDRFLGSTYGYTWSMEYESQLTSSYVNDFVYNLIGSYLSYDQDDMDSASQSGYAEGYQDGLTEGANMDETTLAVWNGILSVGLVPINFFLAIFNFEVLGINITTFVMSLLSVCIVIILLRLIFGGKSSSSGS